MGTAGQGRNRTEGKCAHQPLKEAKPNISRLWGQEVTEKIFLEGLGYVNIVGWEDGVCVLELKTSLFKII